MGFNLINFLKGAAGDVGRAVGTVADAIVPGDQSNWHQPPPTPKPATTRPVSRPNVVQRVAHNAAATVGHDITQLPNFAFNAFNAATNPVGEFVHEVPKIVPPAIHAILGTTLPTKTPVTVGQVIHQLPQADATVATHLPIVKEGLQFGMSPPSQQTLPNLVKGFTGTGFGMSDLGAAERTGARILATATQKPVHLPGAETQQPVNKEIGDAKGIVGKALAASEIAGDLVGLKAPGEAAAVAAVKGGKAAARGNEAFNKTLENVKPGLSQAGQLALPPGEHVNAPEPVNPPAGTKPASTAPPAPGKATRYASRTVPESPNVSEPIRTQVKAEAPTYDVQTERAGLGAAAQKIRELGPDAAVADIQKRLDVPNGKISRQDAIDAQAVAAGLDARGGDVAQRQATDIYKRLSEHLTASGQTVQAAAMLARRSPAGLKYQAISDLRKAGVDVTPELSAKIDQHIEDIKKAGDGPDRGKAVGGLGKTVMDNIPTPAIDKAIGFWKAGLLTGIRTQTGNLVGNTGNLLIKKAADAPAAAIDKAFSVFTHQRTKTFTLRGLTSGAAEGTKQAVEHLKTGVEERGSGEKLDQTKSLNYKNPAINAYVNGVFRLMSAADRPTWYAAQKNALFDLAKSDGLNKGLKGAELKQHVTQAVAHPTDDMAQSAVNTAEKAVFANDTVLSKVASGIRIGLSKHPVAQAAMNVIMPFTKVPSSVISQVFDYTPVGAARELFTQIANRNFDQRAMSEAFGKATVGVAGPITAGIALSNAGLLTGAFPKDPKEQAAWKAEGKQPNSVLVGGKWRSLNYLSPYGPLLAMGQNISQAIQQGQGALSGIEAAAGSGVQSALGQSFLQGVNGVLDAINDPSRYFASTARNMAASVVPTLVKDVATAFDPLQRQANTVTDALKARIPGLRETLLPSVDSLGNTQQNKNSAPTTLFDPTRPTTNVTNPLYTELNRLQATKNGVFPVTQKSIGTGSNAIKLTPAQVNQRQRLIGAQLTPLWNQIIASSAYAQLDDAHKALALQRAATDISTAVDRTLTSQIDPSKNKSAASGNVLKILQGNPPGASTYLAKAANAQNGIKSTGAKTPQERYQAAVDRYNANKNTLSSLANQKAQGSLAREGIRAQYSQDVLDFYDMSKAEETAFFKSNPDQAKQLYDQAKQLDQQIGGRKYKYGLGAKPKAARKARAAKVPGTSKIKKSYNFASSTVKAPKKTAFSTTALRNLVKAPKLKVSKPKAARLSSSKVKLAKASKAKVTA